MMMMVTILIAMTRTSVMTMWTKTKMMAMTMTSGEGVDNDGGDNVTGGQAKVTPNNNKRHTFSVVYHSKVAGLHKSKGVCVKEHADFHVHSKGAGTEELDVTIRGPRGTDEAVKRTDIGDGVFEFKYCPAAPGKYTITITWGGHNIPRSPFEVIVEVEAGTQKVRAWRPGLETGVVGISANFVVEVMGTEVGTLDFSIEGPSLAKIECEDKGDGSCDLCYWPTEPGEYAVYVVCDNEDIKGSPFIAHILTAPLDHFSERVKAHGPSLAHMGCVVDAPAEFTMDARAAG
ncbi:unnamed protein product [Lampetra fluviatilis]